MFLLGDNIPPLAQLLGLLLEPDPLGLGELLGHRLHSHLVTAFKLEKDDLCTV
jgi:hypothetical protein